jgi:hypothetical protein
MSKYAVRLTSEAARRLAWHRRPFQRIFSSVRPCKQCANQTPDRYTNSDTCVTCAKAHSLKQRVAVKAKRLLA